MELIGYRRNNFQTNDGVNVTGNNVFFATEIDPKRGAGMSVDRYYVSDALCTREGIDLPSLLGKQVKIYYNRYGKVGNIVLADD